jgi:spore maturation protein CgeD
MNPLVSVILTSYNKPLTIAKAIKSVLKQSYTDWELLIMDDNSNEETVQIIMKYLKDKRIKYHNSKIQDSERYKTTRYATLINKSIPLTKGNYITYLTDDNEFLPNRLKIMAKYLESHPKADVVYSKQMVKTINNNGEEIKTFIRRTYGILDKPAGYVDHCSIMHSRLIANKVYDKYGSFWNEDPKYWFNGDAAFWKRLTEFGVFYPIHEILDVAYKAPDSFQRLYSQTPKIIPDGTLIKGPATDIFLIDRNQRRKIASKEIFTRLKYDASKILKVPDPYLFKYQEGPLIDLHVFSSSALMPNCMLIKSANKSHIYYIQNNKKHLIPNEETLIQYFFHMKKIILVSEELIHQFENGPDIKPISDVDAFIPDGILFFCRNKYYISLQNSLCTISKQTAVNLKLPVHNPLRVGTPFISRYFKN